MSDGSLSSATDPTGVLVQDTAGDYYLLTPDILAQARLTAEVGAALAAQVGAVDVQGYLLSALSVLGTVVLPADGAHTIRSPRDSASGQATGKRTHRPL